MQIEKTDLFEKAPVSKAILSLVIPTIISQIIFVIYNMADTFFIGQLGDPNQVAAATLAMPPFVLLTGIANIFGIGGASLISRSLGNGDKEKAKNCSAFSVWTAAIIAFLYGMVMFCFRSAVFPVLGADVSTYGFCLDYIFWTITVGAVPTVLNVCLGHLIRSEGFSRQASAGMALGGILNMILDPIFIFGFHFEIAGAAIATMLSNSAATIYFLLFIVRRRKISAISVSPKHYSLKNKIPAEVLAVGLPSFLMIVLGILSSWTANKLVVSYSNQAVAGMGIAKKLDMLTFAIANGMTQGVLPLIAYNFSAKNHDRMREAIKTAFSYCLVVAVTCTILLLVFAVPISQLFIDDAETIAYAKHFLRIICITCPAISITTMIITLFQATAQKVQPTVLSILKRGVVDVFLMMLMNRIVGVNGIPWATFVADIFAMLVAVCLFVPYWKSVKVNIRCEVV
ncbi:MAG: MATE family efflux transporter [Oscillospiraceae bacterium]|nr:MATE family efflux transporter [Oscillospiraceae bacterium]